VRLAWLLIPAPRGLVTVVVQTARSGTAGLTSVAGWITKYANVTAFSRSSALDEVRGALSALRWGTLSEGTPGGHLIVLGKSIGNVRLGERRRAVERALGHGTPRRRGVVSYLGGRLVVGYEFHDRVYPWVSYLETRWPGYRTRSGVRVSRAATICSASL
jgi:hypothetical protein